MASNTSRSLQVSPEKLPLIETALLQFSSKRNLAAQLEMSPTTITNFCKGRKVQRRQFHRICKKLKVDWREVAGIAAASKEDNSQPEAESQIPASTPTRSVPHNIPSEGRAGFFGRETELAELRRRLGEKKQVAIAAVAGMGGVGKTELAVRYARGYLSDYPGGVCWIDCRGIDAGLQIVQWVQTHYQLKPPEEFDLVARVQWCWQQVATPSSPRPPVSPSPPPFTTLVVFDDVSHYPQQVKPYLPEAEGFEVLLTTRLDLGIEQLSLNQLQPIPALELLGKLLGEKRSSFNSDRCKSSRGSAPVPTPAMPVPVPTSDVSVPKSERGNHGGITPTGKKKEKLVGIERLSCDLASQKDDASALCEWLGYLPLGLELAGRYLARESKLSFGKMLARLKKKGLAHKALVGDETTDSTWTLAAKRGVAAAFELSWEVLDEDTRKRGCVLSLYAPVRLGFLSREALEKFFEDEDAAEEWVEARGELEKHHLLQAEDGGYRFHPLIREFFALKREEYPEAEEWQQDFVAQMVAVARSIPEMPTLEKIQTLEPEIPHLVEVVEQWLGKVNNEDLVLLFAGLGSFYMGQGLYALAESFYETSRDVTIHRLGENHPDVATSLNNLAALYLSQGRYDEAETLFQHALRLVQYDISWERNPKVTLCLNNLATLYCSQGRYNEAEPLYQQSLVLRRKLLGENHPDVASSLNNLAELYRFQGRYDEIELLLNQSLALRRKLLGENHPDVASSLNNLAELYRSQGRYDEAEPLFKEALKLWKQLLGNHHPNVAIALNNLAALYLFQERYDESEPLLKQALELRQTLLGNQHPDVAISLNNLALLYKSQGKYDQAEPIYQKVIVMLQQRLGDNHPNVATSLANLALLYKSQGKYDQAEPLLQRALGISDRSLGIAHPTTMLFRSNYARCLRESSAVANSPNLPENASVEEIVTHWQRMLEDAGEDE